MYNSVYLRKDKMIKCNECGKEKIKFEGYNGKGDKVDTTEEYCPDCEVKPSDPYEFDTDSYGYNAM
jgi:hypothetical protein